MEYGKPEVAYVDRDGLPWLLRWMAARPAEEVHLLVARDAAEEVRALQSDWGARVELVDATGLQSPDSADSSDLHAFFARHKPEEIVLPRALPSRHLGLFPTQHIPNLEREIPLLKALQDHGVGSFRVMNAGGEGRLRMERRFSELRNRHQGQRAFVVGNGPSLNAIDMGKLRKEVVLGSNRCFLGFPKWGFEFPYWGISDELQIFTYGHEYEGAIPDDTVKFCPFHYLPLLGMKNMCPVQVRPTAGERSFSVEEPFGGGYSVTYMLLQLAAAMGCNPIVLVGVDHSYDLEESRLSHSYRALRECLVRPIRGSFLYHAIHSWRDQKRNQNSGYTDNVQTWDGNSAKGETHFHASYTQQGQVKFAMPQPWEAEKDYSCARQWAEGNGVEILNATPDTALHVFEKIDFNSLF
jgi:hypothetical protein